MNSLLLKNLKKSQSLVVRVNDYITTTVYTYPDFVIKMHCFLVYLDRFDGRLNEHVRFALVRLNEVDRLDWIEADRPVLNLLKEKFTHVFSK